MSDGYGDVERLLAAQAALPGGADLNAQAARLDATTESLRNAVVRQAGLLEAARVVLALAGVAAKSSGVPLGSTMIDVARAALDAATAPRA